MNLKLALLLYGSFDTPFELAVEYMKEIGDTLRFLVNAKLLHERRARYCLRLLLFRSTLIANYKELFLLTLNDIVFEAKTTDNAAGTRTAIKEMTFDVLHAFAILDNAITPVITILHH